MNTENNSSHPLQISADKPWLAPLAGYSDLPFRLLCRDFGANVACTEMVSAKGLVYKSNGTHNLLNTTEADSISHPLVVQLFGSEAPFMQEAVSMLQKQGFKYFDLNMGCSVPKVNRSGSGSAMLKDIDNSLNVAKCMLELVEKKHMGFKIRLGWTDDSHVWQELSLGLQELGAGWITLHPRTAKQGFRGEAAWEYLSKLKNVLDIPVIASGDLFTAKQGVECILQTGVDTVMYARGAMHNPAIFADHEALWQMGAENAYKYEEKPNLQRLKHIIRRHMELAKMYSHERIWLLKMRTFVPRYVHSFPGVKQLRKEMAQCKNAEDLHILLNDFFAGCEENCATDL